VTSIEIEALVAQALDDLEAEHIDVPEALRLVATIAYRQGRRDAEHSGSADLPEPRPAQAREDEGREAHRPSD
jgi:hypothetical protein